MALNGFADSVVPRKLNFGFYGYPGNPLANGSGLPLKSRVPA